MTRPSALPRFHFFSGKGGVGKTTLAAATALGEAEAGQQVLVLSTDPAHSLGDALGVRLGQRPRRIATRRGTLHAAELDATAALERWLTPRRDTLRRIAERGTYLDREDLDRFLHLALPGIDELMALLELWRRAQEGGHQLVVVDTAPTGHTLRLLETPQTLATMARVFDDMEEKHRVLAQTLGGVHREDAEDALIAELARDAEALEGLLRDRTRTRFTWVLTPEALPVAETVDGVEALEGDGIRVDELVVNRVTPPPPQRCGRCRARRAQQRAEVVRLLEQLPSLPVRFLPLQPSEPRGARELRALWQLLGEPGRGRALIRPSRAARALPEAPQRTPAPGGPLALEVPASVRLLLFGGKGGVGKSTASAALALALARAQPERQVLLLSIDPARRMKDVLAAPVGSAPVAVPGAPSNFRAQQLDAQAAFAREKQRYAQSVDAVFDGLRQGSRFDAAYDRAILRELIDLAPPGLDELFALFSVLDTLFPPAPGPALPAGGRTRPARRTPPPGVDLLVVDTAPTGHALRLLELPQVAQEWTRALLAILLKYQQAIGLGQMAENLLALARQLRQLQATLADPALARFVVVTRPAALPRLETARLLEALGRLAIHVPAVLLNGVVPDGLVPDGVVPDGLAPGPVLLGAASPAVARPAGASCSHLRGTASREADEQAALAKLLGRHPPRPRLLLAPELLPPPLGVRALEAFAHRWTAA